MADQRDGGIDWCDETWNPIRGCSRVSPGCGGARGVGGCYAERVAARFSKPGQPYHGLAVMGEHGPRWTGQVRMVPEHLNDPLRWKRPRRIFVNSMSDLFHEKLADDARDRIFAVMALAPRHTFQILTKRSERMHRYMTEDGIGRVGYVEGRARQLARELRIELPEASTLVWPLPNVWLGVTAEDQQRADERIPLLLQTPAAIRFVSVEPQLGPVKLTPWLREGTIRQGNTSYWHARGLDWVICGAESGRGARPFDPAWARSLRDQCVAAGVPFFFKQVLDGYGKKVHAPEIDGRAYQEFPR